MRTLTLIVIFCFAFLAGGCAGDGFTVDNASSAPAATTTPTTGADIVAPQATCQCPGTGRWCKVEQVGKVLHCETFTGGCAGQDACKADTAASGSTSCDDGNVGTSEGWIDTVNTGAVLGWSPWAANRFQCKLAAGSGSGAGSSSTGSGQTQIGCVANGCPTGQSCNSATGQCQTTQGQQGDIICKFRRTDSTSWSMLHGGSVANAAAVGKDSWTPLGKPDTGGYVTFTVKAGHDYVSILPQLTDDAKLWGFGWVNGVAQIVGIFEITCGGNPAYVFKQGTTNIGQSVPGNLPTNTGFGWYDGTGNFRLAFNVR